MGKPSTPQDLTNKRVREIRRRQFFNFFADFYDKYEDAKMRQDDSFTFTNKEKEQSLKSYFKKYYRDDRFLPTVIKNIPLACDIASKKRLCDCKNQVNNLKPIKTIRVEMLQERPPGESKDQYLDKSEGIYNTFNAQDSMQIMLEQLENKVENANSYVYDKPQIRIKRSSLAQSILEK